MQPETNHETPSKDAVKLHLEGTNRPMFRLGEHENWLSMELVQRVIDILNEHHRPFLSALLGEAATGEKPRARR